MRFLVRLGEDQQPAAHEQHLDVARLDAGVALDDGIDSVEAFAEVARDQHFPTAKAQHERGWCVFHAEIAVQCGHDKILFVGLASKRFKNITTTV